MYLGLQNSYIHNFGLFFYFYFYITAEHFKSNCQAVLEMDSFRFEGFDIVLH